MVRLLVTGGGTGGHVYPALAVLQAGQANGHGSGDILTDGGTSLAHQSKFNHYHGNVVRWIGSRGGLEQPLVERAGISYVGVEAAGVRGLDPLTIVRNLARLAQGVVQAWRQVRAFRPDVVLATGGYVTIPVGLAAWAQRIPLMMYLPDIEPGLAVRGLAPFATRIAVTALPATRHFANGKAVVTGYPVRPELERAGRDRRRAKAVFGIPPDEQVVLVFGGSQGARSLNRAVGANLTGLLELAHLLHLHGRSDGEWLRERERELPPALQERYHLYDYLHEEMVDALLAADLVVARAGASILGELPAAGVPAVLVPYPYSGAHQWANANFLAAQGAADVIADEWIAAELLPAVRRLLADTERLVEMGTAMRRLARPDAAQHIYTLLKRLAGSSGAVDGR